MEGISENAGVSSDKTIGMLVVFDPSVTFTDPLPALLTALKAPAGVIVPISPVTLHFTCSGE